MLWTGTLTARDPKRLKFTTPSLKGHVVLKVINNVAGTNAVLSAVFFGIGGAVPIDTSAPVIGTMTRNPSLDPLPAGTPAIQFSFTTDKNAACSIGGGTSGQFMTAFGGDGTSSHAVNLTTFNGEGWSYNIICTNSNAGGQSSAATVVTVNQSQPAATSAATFIKTDVVTQGSWKGVYGTDGEMINSDVTAPPAYAQVTIQNSGSFPWAPSTTDLRALQKGSASDRIASTWYTSGMAVGSSYTIDMNLTDGAGHQVALYALDWDSYGPRNETIEVHDAASNQLLDSRSVTNFNNGQYVVWSVKGHVIFKIINNAGNSNGVLSGIFFGAGTSATPTTLTCVPGAGPYASGLAVTCLAGDPSHSFTLSWWDPNGTRFDMGSINGKAVTPALASGSWKVCAQDIVGDVWPAGGCAAPALYALTRQPQSKIVLPKDKPTQPAGSAFAFMNAQYYAKDPVAQTWFAAPPVNSGATSVKLVLTMNTAYAPSPTCFLNYNGTNNAVNINSTMVTICFGKPSDYLLDATSCDHFVSGVASPLAAQSYSWSATCTAPAFANNAKATASGSFTVNPPCQTTADCGSSNFYCAAGGICTALGQVPPAIVVTSPAPGANYAVGQSADFDGGTLGIGPTSLAKAQLTILLDGAPVGSLVPSAGTYQAPAPFAPAQVGSHQVSVVVTRPDLLDIQGKPVVLAQSSAIPITVTAAPSCSATSDCATGMYCTSKQVCQLIPAAAVTMTSPSDNQVFTQTDSVSFAAQAAPLGVTGSDPIGVMITADGTSVCSTLGTTCNASQTLSIASHTVTAIAYVKDIQGNSVQAGISPSVAVSVTPTPGDFALGDLIVKYKDGATQATVNPKYAVSAAPSLFSDAAPGTAGNGQAYILKVPGYTDITQAMQDYQNDPNVEYAQPNLMYGLDGVTPNDYYWDKKGDIPNSPTVDDMWPWKRMKWDEAAAIAPELGLGIKIAVIDTGADFCHPDLAGNLDVQSTADITRCPLLPETSKPAPDCVLKHWPIDKNGHGTATSGMVAATMNNTIGMTGIAPRSTVVPVKAFMAAAGTTSTEFLLRAVDYVRKNKIAQIISLSVSGVSGPLEKDDKAFRASIAAAIGQGIVVVKSAGNKNADVINYSPENMVSPKPIVVAGVTLDDHKWDQSNYGSTVDVAAFSRNVFTTSLRGGALAGYPHPIGPTGQPDLLYAFVNGTSISGPEVAGLAAVMLSGNHNLTPDQIRQEIMQSADQISDGMILGTSHSTLAGTSAHAVGRINAYHAVELAKGITSTPPAFKSLAVQSSGVGNPQSFDPRNAPVNFNYGVTLVFLVVDISNVTGCTLDNGTVLYISDQSLDEYFYIYETGTFVDGVEKPLQAQAYPYSVTCTDLWGAKINYANSFTINPAPPTGNSIVNDSVPSQTVRIYPNPWKSSQGVSTIMFEGLSSGTTVKLFTIAGRSIKTLHEAGGKAPWDLTNNSGDKVASGIYMYVITDAQSNRLRGKVTVIR